MKANEWKNYVNQLLNYESNVHFSPVQIVDTQVYPNHLFKVSCYLNFIGKKISQEIIKYMIY